MTILKNELESRNLTKRNIEATVNTRHSTYAQFLKTTRDRIIQSNGNKRFKDSSI